MFKPTTDDLIDATVNDILRKMLEVSPDSPEYTTMASNIETLRKAKAQNLGNRMTPAIAAGAAVNLLGIAMILKHEQLNVITTKAISLLGRKTI